MEIDTRVIIAAGLVAGLILGLLLFLLAAGRARDTPTRRGLWLSALGILTFAAYEATHFLATRPGWTEQFLGTGGFVLIAAGILRLMNAPAAHGTGGQ